MKDYNTKDLVVKNNQLVESQYKLTLQEQKLVLSVVSMIKPEDKKFHEYRLSVKEFKQLADIDGESYYSEIIKFSKSLLKKPIVIIKKNKTPLVVNWFSSIDEVHKGIWEFSFDPKLKFYLLQLKQEFTNYQLRNVIRLNSKYAIRLYELLKQYLSIGERFIELSDLRLMLGIDMKQYKFFNDFKMKVLEKARKELSQKTDIQFTWKPVKTVRKITGIHFSIQKNKTREKEKNEAELQELINIVPERHRSKETVKKSIQRYLKLKGFEYVKSHIEYSNIYSNKSYSVFLKRSLKENWEFETGDVEKLKEENHKRKEEEQNRLIEEQEGEARRQLNIDIVESLTKDQEQALRDYIYIQKDKRPVGHDMQNKRAQYKKGTLVTYLESYLVSIVTAYIESIETDSIETNQILGWFQGYTKINNFEIFESIMQDSEIKKYLSD